jgi:N-acetyl-1-D-myo-inositol-2-amino-2-deoxy-alpha-D-glucopyranoside deacetylase
VTDRLLLFHAHPDDETITTGATMAKHAAAGTAVTLVTSTLGELGEILVPSLAGLEVGRADQLGGYRLTELEDAMAALGVSDHRFLGGAGRWRDSGMLGTPGNDDPRAFWACSREVALFDEAVAQAVAIIDEVRPELVITYDADGGYGHPDHVMTHRVAMAAIDRAEWRTPALWWVTEKETDMTVDATAHVGAKITAMRAHATQITVVDEQTFALSDGVPRELTGVESFLVARGAA